MRQIRTACIGVCLSVFVAGVAYAQEQIPPSADPLSQVEALPWTKYPAIIDLAGHATVPLFKGLEYLGSGQSAQFIQLNGNPPPSVPAYIISKNNFQWFAVFSFDESGYVKDDEKIDADKLLSSLQEGNRQNAERRKQLGLGSLSLVGWYVSPHYDISTHRLEWGTKLVDDQNNITVNYTVRLLARNGVMSATLISSPGKLDADIVEFKNTLDSIKFNSGQNYAEFRAGDKVAAYGLGALVIGGAAAVAVKSGAGLFKALGVGLLAIVAGVLNWFKNLFGRRRKS